MPDRLPQLMMRRDLSELPRQPLPDGISIRSYREGDDATWEAITNDAFQWKPEPGTFARHMQASRWFRPERVLFLRNEHRLVATASAWVEETYGANAGVLHFVAVLRKARGRQWGLHVSLAAMRVMAEEGRRDVVLRTDDDRLPAIRTYLKLGFSPLLVHENQRSRWRTALREAQYPEKVEAFADILEGPVVQPASSSQDGA